MKMVAHRLKGAAANVSAEAVHADASRLETAGRKGELAEAPELLSQLRCALVAVIELPLDPLPGQAASPDRTDSAEARTI